MHVCWWYSGERYRQTWASFILPKSENHNLPMRASVFYKHILFHNLMNKFKNVEKELDLEYESITLWTLSRHVIWSSVFEHVMTSRDGLADMTIKSETSLFRNPHISLYDRADKFSVVQSVSRLVHSWYLQSSKDFNKRPKWTFYR